MSVLKTITFEELRDRNNAALKAQSYQPKLDIANMNARERDNLERLFDKRVQIETLASTQNQREAHGVERWHKNFVRLQDIHEDPNIECKGAALRNYIWNRVPNSRFKRFQEIFCHPHHFAVPRFELDAEGRVLFPGKPDFNSLPLQACLVSPDRIPDQFAADLGLCDFTEDHGKPWSRLKKKALVIDRLKLMWESAEPLQEKHHRLLLIQPPTQDTRLRYNGTEGPDRSTIGTILYTREEENGHQQKNLEHNGHFAPKRRTAQYFDSAYGAHRKTFHENQVYLHEITLLTELQEDLTTLNRVLNVEWRKGIGDERRAELRIETQQLFLRFCDLLKACQNKYKVHAHDLIAGVSELRDKRGKENMTVVMTKMIAAIGQLAQRFNDMYPKGGYNQQDQMVLQRHIEREEKLMKDFRVSLVRHAPVLEASHPLFEAEQLSPEARGTLVRQIEIAMGLHMRSLERVCLEPLHTYALRLQEKAAKLHRALHEGDRDRAMDVTVEMHVMGKLQAVRTCFEHIKRFVIDAEQVPVERIRNFVAALEQLFSERQLFPDRIVDGYREPFEAIERQLTLIKQQLTIYAGQNLEIDQRSAMYQRLKRYLEGFDLEEMARNLP